MILVFTEPTTQEGAKQTNKYHMVQIQDAKRQGIYKRLRDREPAKGTSEPSLKE